MTALIFAVWSIAAAIASSHLIVPTVGQTATALWRLLCSSEFWTAFFYTVLRSVFGLLLSFAIAYALAYFSVTRKAVKRFLSPLITVLRSLPTMAVVLLLTVWFPSALVPIVIALLVVMPTLYSGFVAAAIAEGDLLEIARINGASQRQTFAAVFAPKIGAAIPETLSAAAGLSVKLTVSAEILAQTADALGTLMKLNQIYFETASLIALTVSAVIAAALLQLVVKSICKGINAKLRYD